MKTVLIVGCGDVGRRVAGLYPQARVYGAVRSAESASRLKTRGIEPRLVDLDQPFNASELPVSGAEVYYFAPPPAEGEYDSRVAAFCGVLREGNRPVKLVYISTSAVYGDCGGNWIDETAPLRPGTARGRRRLDAERRLLRWGESQNVPVVLLRVPGIYGPDRLPVKRLRDRLPVLADKDSPYTNRIHVDDLARICIAAMRNGRKGEAYNVSDGHPGKMTDYFNQVADMLGLARPPVVDRDAAERMLSSSMLSFLSESKRLVNDKMLRELGVSLRYKRLSEGLLSASAG